MIIQDSAPPGALVVGRLARGTAGESRRVVHVFPADAVADTGELITGRCGEALTRADVEWVRPGTGMPCEGCLGLQGTGMARYPRPEVGV
ncbi:hypothetical protein [Amycolatopsis samaneae]|uniref:Uncharacterized protein n=1 Tax=Amycolatopsis samaneae TaxID=664691 RepID=A0ABW5GGJ4_9PSEU